MWNNLEHQIWNKLKQQNLEDESVFLLAVSGGLDSMVLFSVMKKIKPLARFILMHYHHGPGPHLDHRNDYVRLIESLQSNQVIVEIDRSEHELKSENDFREERLKFFEKIKTKYQIQFYLTAHHRDDVLETRLIKMIRGTGLQGLAAFEEWNQKILRPCFEVNKSDLEKYAAEQKIVWISDPSNDQDDYLRNWIRNQWLTQLNQKMPGASDNLAKSIQNMLDESGVNLDRYALESARYVTCSDQFTRIDRLWLSSFSTKDQLVILIKVIKESFRCDFSTNQIKEVLKRLDKNQNEHIFRAASINWVINAQSIMLKYGE